MKNETPNKKPLTDYLVAYRIDNQTHFYMFKSKIKAKQVMKDLKRYGAEQVIMSVNKIDTTDITTKKRKTKK